MNYTRLNEGQQAEEYKARKAKEEEDRKKAEKLILLNAIKE